MNTRQPPARFPARTIAAIAMLLAIGSVHATPLDDMVAFDAVYIPALASSTNASQHPAAVPKAKAALAALRQQWPTLRQRLVTTWGVVPATGWPQTLASVEKRIDAAINASRQSDWKRTHETLEPVRIDLMLGRQRQGMDYFVDRLTAFHEPMEKLVMLGATLNPNQLDDKHRAEMQRTYTEARTLWKGIELYAFDAAAYSLSASRKAQLRSALSDETAALSQLADALQHDNSQQLLKAAVAIKPPFAKAFTAFGKPDD